MNTAAELRTTSDMLLLDLQALGDLEEEKRVTPHGDPKLVDLAARIEELAHRVLSASQRQRELSEDVSLAVETGEVAHEESIATMRSASAILAEWRDAERALAETVPGSMEEARALEIVNRYREEYRRAFNAVRRDLR